MIVACSVALVGAFIALPGDLAQKAHLALHGICAQRPSHSLRLGGELLPLDARMSGIYIGAAMCGAWLLASGRLRAAARVPRPVVVMLAAFVALMAIDGTNGLLLDLGLPRPYEPSNLARMVTGVLAGISLGSAVGHLFAISIWATPCRSRPLMSRPRELLIPVLAAMLTGGLALSGLPVLYAPVTLGLVVAALAVFWAFALIVLALVTGRAWRVRRYSELASLGTMALLVAAVVLALFSLARLAAEHYLGLPQLT